MYAHRKKLLDCQVLLPASQAFASLTRSPQSLVSCSSRCAWQRGTDVSQDQVKARAV